ncbi:MAG: bifunctional diguanylate cyclase/phosphodiesterase, partial [Campylobacterota bacterium]|nr:bifunctional diguanylate cyclase/phosphodiesterase [Campylobacterota bacterium]
MKLKKLIFLVFSVGIISSVSIVYFYILQRDFTKYHREFIISINALENAHADLKHQILQSSIYSYHNQDEVSAAINRIEDKYKKLKRSNILEYKTYTQVKIDLISLKKLIDANLQNIEEYIMLNAGIKNSLVFLSRRIENATYLQKEDRTLFIQATKILKHFNDAKRMQDIDYINNKIFLLKSKSKDLKTKKF